MSGHGPVLDVDASGLRVAIVAASWHDEVMDGLIAGAQRALGGSAEVIRVPGTFELSVACARLAPAYDLSLIHISEPTRRLRGSRMPSSA